MTDSNRLVLFDRVVGDEGPDIEGDAVAADHVIAVLCRALRERNAFPHGDPIVLGHVGEVVGKLDRWKL